MKKIIFGLFIFYFIDSYSQDSCAIKIFPGDCLNCYIGMKKVETTDSAIKKTIVFPELSRAEVNAYLQNVLNISDISKFTVIVSDSVYHSMNNSLTSEVYVYSENKLYKHELLKKFYGIDEHSTYRIKIPDSIAISLESGIINTEKYFFITDPKFGNCIFVSKHAPFRIHIFKAKDLTTESNFYKLSGDTVCYAIFSKYRDVLKSANMDKMLFKSTFGKEIMSSFILAPNIEEQNGNAGLKYIIGIIIFTAPDEYRILRIDETSIPDDYVIYPGFFGENNGSYYIQMANKDRTVDDQYLLGKFTLTNDKLVFSEFPGFKVPTEYLPATTFKSLRKILISANPYLFLQYSRSFYDMDNEQNFLLPFDSINLEFDMPDNNINMLKFEYSLKLVDAYASDKTIFILHEKSGKYYIAQVDRKDLYLKKITKVVLPKKLIKAGLRFYSSDELYYLSKDNSIVIEKIKFIDK